MKKSIAMMLSMLLVYSCSTTRLVPEGSYRLTDNFVEIKGQSHLKPGDLSPYIRQQANNHLIFGWAPAVSIYNWSDKDDKGLSKIWKKIGEAPVVYNKAVVPSSIENIKDRLHYLGYYSPSIYISEKYNGRKVAVTYHIDPGSPIMIDSVSYSIPEEKEFAELFTLDSLNSLVRPGVPLSENLLEQESIRSTAFFRGNGYYDFTKGSFTFEADTLSGNGKAQLNYTITPYETNKYKFGKVSFSIPEGMKFRESVLQEMNTVVPGTPYNDTEVNRTYSRLASLRVFNNVTIQTKPTDSLEVDCDVTLMRSKTKGVRVNLEGSATTTGLFGITPQMTFYHKNIFRGGEWFNLGFSGSFQSKPKEGARAEEYSITSGISFPKAIFFNRLSRKSSFASRTEVKASFNFQNRPEFARRVLALSFGYTGVTRQNIQYQIFPIQLNTTHLKNISEEYLNTLIDNPLLYYSYSDHFDIGFGTNLYYTTNTDIVPTTSYHYYRLMIETSGNILSLFNKWLPENEFGEKMIFNLPYTQYVRGEFVYGRNWRFGRDNGQALAVRVDIGAAYGDYGNFEYVPFEKQFYVGGASSMRGWQARCLGPGSEKYINGAFAIPSQAGEFKMEFDAEYRFKLIWKFEGALFAEAGNVWNFPYNDELLDIYSAPGLFRFNDFYKKIAADWGLGLRLNLNFIVLRFDFGMKVYDPSANEGARWAGPSRWFSGGGNAFHFGVGYPF